MSSYGELIQALRVLKNVKEKRHGIKTLASLCANRAFQVRIVQRGGWRTAILPLIISLDEDCRMYAALAVANLSTSAATHPQLLEEEVLRSLTFWAASPVKYRIITRAGNPHIQVAQADSEEECFDLLKKLNSLTAEDIMAAFSPDKKDMLEQLLERAKSTNMVVANDHQEFLSIEMLQKISNLESEKASLQKTLEEAQKTVRNKELEKQDFQEKCCLVMAQQALEHVAENMKDDAKWAKSTTETTSTENGPDNLGQPSEGSASSGGTSGAEPRQKQQAGAALEISAEALTANLCSSQDVIPLLFPPGDPGSTHENVEIHHMEPKELEKMSFEQRVMHGPFHRSMAKEFWQLAGAPYRGTSCNHVDSKDYVEYGGRLWEVIVHNPATETLVIGRKDTTTSVLEVGFRGTVTEDAHGNTSWANWASNVHTVTAPLQGSDGDNLTVLVHKGFQDAYLAINLAVISWLESNAGNEPLLRIAGHSLGAALATLFAVDIKQRGWQIDGVVTFGSPRVGQRGFKSLYQELELHNCTVRFANDYDPVTWVPAHSWGFEHVVVEYALGSQAPTGNPHSMTGSSMSYLHTLQDAVDGRAVPHIASRGLNLITDIKAMESTVRDVAMQMKQELKVDIALLRQDVSKLAEGMEAAVQELKNSVRQLHDWKDVLDMETLIDFVNHYKSQLQTWQHCVPEWFRDYKKQLKRILQAAKVELKDLKSPLAPKFVLLYLHAASFLIAAMGTTGARPRDIEKEFGDFVAAAKVLVSNCFHLNLCLQNQIFQLLPNTHDVSSAGDRDVHLTLQAGILKLRGRSCQLGSPLFQLMKWIHEPDMDTLELQLGSEYADTLLQQLPQSLSSLRLNFGGHTKKIDDMDAFVQQLASNMPQNLTSLSLDFGYCWQITDESVQQLEPDFIEFGFWVLLANHR
eukprot:s637_g3.t1